MAFPLLALALSTQLVAVSADGVPSLNVNPTCRSPMRVQVGGSTDVKICFDDEADAKNELAKRWTQFNKNDRAQCSGLVRTGGPPSYVELLTCLDTSREGHQFEAQERKQEKAAAGTSLAHHSPKR